MSRDSKQNREPAVWKYIFLSVLLHIIAIGSFIFVVPLISESHKPQMVFLGQILTGRDMGHSNAFKVQPDLPDPNSEELYHHKGIEAAPYAQKEEQKPHQAKDVKMHNKITMKSIFDTSYQPKKKIEDTVFIEKLQKTFEQESYNPLALPK